MSRLWREERAQAASSLGSFVIRRGETPFRAWGDGRPAENDGVFESEDALSSREDLAYARGLADGRRTLEAELAADRDALVRLAEVLPSLKPESTLPLALLLAETVDRLVREIVGEVDIDGLKLLSRAKAAAALIGEATQPARLRVHPEDAVLLRQADLDVAVEADPALARGAVLVETAEGWIEDGPAVRLERLRTELDKVAAAR
jgi:flagellar assembly protein FliH